MRGRARDLGRPGRCPTLHRRLRPSTTTWGAFGFVSGYRLYQMAGGDAMVQGRCLFGGVIGLSVLVAAGLPGCRAPWVLVGMAVLGAAAVVAGTLSFAPTGGARSRLRQRR